MRDFAFGGRRVLRPAVGLRLPGRQGDAALDQAEPAPGLRVAGQRALLVGAQHGALVGSDGEAGNLLVVQQVVLDSVQGGPKRCEKAAKKEAGLQQAQMRVRDSRKSTFSAA